MSYTLWPSSRVALIRFGDSLHLPETHQLGRVEVGAPLGPRCCPRDVSAGQRGSFREVKGREKAL